MVLKVSLNTGINRIRLEFKVYRHRKQNISANSVLIESDWNLKHVNQNTGIDLGIVLIESDWNLKINFIFNKNGTFAY